MMRNEKGREEKKWREDNGGDVRKDGWSGGGKGVAGGVCEQELNNGYSETPQMVIHKSFDTILGWGQDSDRSQEVTAAAAEY